MAAATVVIAAAPAAAGPAIAYREVAKMSMQGTPAAEPSGAFDAEWKRAIERPGTAKMMNQAKANQAIGLASAIPGPIGMASQLFMMFSAMSAKKSASTALDDGMPSEKVVADGMTRTDDPLNATATIVDCVARRTVKLDTKSKTYTVEPWQPAMPEGTSMQMPAMKAPGTLDVTVGAQALGSRSVDGVATDGFKESTEIAMGGAGKTGGMTFDATNWYGPTIPSGAACDDAIQANAGGLGDIVTMISSMFTGPMMKRMYGDNFHLNRSGAQVPPGRLALYSAVTMTMSKRPFGISIARGDVRRLSASEAAATFAIPADYREVAAKAAGPQLPPGVSSPMGMPHVPH